MFLFLEFHDVAALVHLATHFRTIVEQYVACATDVALDPETATTPIKGVQTLARDLLCRHARLLRSLVFGYDFEPPPRDVWPEHVRAALVQRNAATMRHATFTSTEEYMAVCACPNLETYVPKTFASKELERYTVFVATRGCPGIRILDIDDRVVDLTERAPQDVRDGHRGAPTSRPHTESSDSNRMRDTARVHTLHVRKLTLWNLDIGAEIGAILGLVFPALAELTLLQHRAFAPETELAALAFMAGRITHLTLGDPFPCLEPLRALVHLNMLECHEPLVRGNTVDWLPLGLSQLRELRVHRINKLKSTPEWRGAILRRFPRLTHLSTS
jgi:hypothetical protein